MNFMEMLLALFAIVFFTSISLVYNRSMWNQAENLDNVAKIIQATHLAHSQLDEIDARLFSKAIKFSEVGRPLANGNNSTYMGTKPVVLTYAGYKFIMSYLRTECDSLGNNPNNSIPYSANNLFFKMTVTIASTPGMSHPVSVYRIYTKTNLHI